MQVEFKRAIRHQDPQDIIISTAFPFDGITVPDFLCDLYQEITASQNKRNIDVADGFAFGGQFADRVVGREPNDFDIYIASPDWVEAVKRYIKACDEACGYKETRELAEEKEYWVLGGMFPLSIMSNNFKMLNSTPLGDYFEFNGTCYDNQGRLRTIDVKVGSKAADMADFITYFSAPIMAAAQSLSDSGSVAYHRFFEFDTKAQLLCTNNLHSSDLKEKAARKGLRIITPASRPFDLGGQGHQDRLGVTAGSEAKLGTPVIQ